MQRVRKIFELESPSIFKHKIIDWALKFEYFCWLDSNEYPQLYSSADAIMAAGVASKIQIQSKGAFEQLKAFQTQVSDYIFGYFSYDLKNDLEQLNSNNPDRIEFPELFFFQPKKIFILRGNRLQVEYLDNYNHEIESDFDEILNHQPTKTTISKVASNYEIKQRISKEAYFESIEKIIKHIKRGDIYEMNFCQEFYVENREIDLTEFYNKLNTVSQSPFASFLKMQHHYALCASPERYLKKESTKIISQPIKGTARRSTSLQEDQVLAEQLLKDPKERAENIMIVDLVRNDLSKIAKKGSVRVEELCRVYPFRQVHQMISTVVCEVSAQTHPIDIIKATFPMGSMTGAPKVSAMKIIEEQESTKRGLYSGSIGYFTPENDFDFNVVIRSILYDSRKKYASYIAGGAITSKSTPEGEYQESLLKAKVMSLVFEES